MKSILPLLLVTSLIFSGCKATQAIDATIGMGSKMDGMNSKMDETNAGIKSTNEAVRLQKLILAKNDMLEEQNTKNLEPVALGMIAGAKKFAEAATTEELIEYTYVLLKEINDQQPDESLKGADGKFPEAVIAEYDHQKMIKFSQITTIAGFTPQEKVDQIINDQVYAGGLYQDEAYAFLMARVLFLGTYLDSSLLAKPLKTLKKMEETINRVGSIDSVLKLPFKDKVRMNVTGFLKRDAIEVSLLTDGQMDDIWNAPVIWGKILRRFDSELKNGNVVSGSNVDQARLQNQIIDLKNRVQDYINSWK